MIGSSQLSSPKRLRVGGFFIHFCCIGVYLCLFSPIAWQANAQNQRSFCFNLSFLQITVEIKEEDRESFLEVLRNAMRACEVVSTRKVNGRLFSINTTMLF